MPALFARPAVSFLGCVLLLGGATLAWAQAQPAPQQPPQLTPAQLEQVETWRRQYPYVSLTQRLQYEKSHKNDPEPKLSPASEKQMALIDIQFGITGHGYNPRARSLELLHSNQVDQFISREGAGVSRMKVTPWPGYLKGADGPPVDFAKLPPLSTEEASLPATGLLHGESDKLGSAQPALLELLPTRSEITSYHGQSTNLFINLLNFGHVKSLDQVAGFVPHAFSSAPGMPLDHQRLTPQPGAKPAPDPQGWKIARLELVSLLKQAEPRVYESEHLPRMDELKIARTRPLNTFEAAGLAKLREGEELPTSSTANRILLLGSLRAGAQCAQCHDVPRGTLLGAFSYELRRDPPLKLQPAAAVQ